MTAFHGVIFGDEMVRALREGRKSQTRRFGKRWAKVQPGDALWVREAHYIHNFNLWPDLRPTSRTYEREVIGGDGRPKIIQEREFCFFREGFDRSKPSGAWKSPIYLPRWASRLYLQVLKVSEVPSADMISNWEAWKEGVTGVPLVPNRDTFLHAFRKLHPKLPWAEGPDGFLYLTETVPCWRVEFIPWPLELPCPSPSAFEGEHVLVEQPGPQPGRPMCRNCGAFNVVRSRVGPGGCLENSGSVY